MRTILTKENDNYKVDVVYDACPVSPFDWDMLGKHYYVGRDISIKDIAIEHLPVDYTIHYAKKYGIIEYNATDKGWHTRDNYYIHRNDLTMYFRDIIYSMDDKEVLNMMRDCKDIVFYECFSHGYSQGDYYEMWSVVTKSMATKYFGKRQLHWKRELHWREKVTEVLQGEVKAIEQYTWGDVFGYILSKKVKKHISFPNGEHNDYDTEEWEEFDSLFGIYDTPDNIANEVMAQYN